MSDISILVRSTLRIYKKAAVGSLRALALNWHLVLLQLLGFVACFLVAMVAGLFGPLAGGFIIGMFLAFVVACYLAIVEAGVEATRLGVKEVLPRAGELWGPVIGVLFVMFILQYFSDTVFSRGDQQWIRAAVGLVIAVLFNPLPEVIYQRPHMSMQMFADSYQFMLENFIEWIFPAAVLGGLLYCVSPELAVTIGMMLVLAHPLRLIEALFMFFTSPAALVSTLPLTIAGLVLVYLVFVFRGVLFHELAGSTRRKRIYQERFW